MDGHNYRVKGELSLAEAAQLLAVSRQMVIRYQRRGELADPLTYASVEALRRRRAETATAQAGTLRRTEVAAILGVSPHTVRDWQDALLLSRRPSREEVARFQRPNRKRGSRPRGELSLAEAAQLLGVSTETVRQRQRRGQLPNPLTRAAVEHAREVGV